jgi:uncharacterized protein YbjT (DUF2867 family)
LYKSKYKYTFVLSNKKQFDMKITIAGSLGNIGLPLTKKLVSAGHDVKVISSKAANQTAIEALGATAAIGSVTDAAFLEEAFTGADAVYVMTPPNLGGVNIIANTTAAGEAFSTAIQKSGVSRVVMLSSIGADIDGGTGPIAGLHKIEKIYEKLENVHVTFLRAGYFYNNFFNDIPVIKGAGIIGSNYPSDTHIPLVHPEDIALAVAEELENNVSAKNIRYIVGDVRTATDIAAALGHAVGKPELPWVEFTDEQSLQGMTQAGLPQEMAGLYVEMGVALRQGKLQSDFDAQGSPVTGNIKLEDFAKMFTEAF